MPATSQTVDAASIEPSLPRPHGSPIGRQSHLTRGLELWHLLSLDAPSVAMLWTWFLARNNHIPLPGTAILAMGIAVWMLYAADRLLDARTLQSSSSVGQAELEPRHYFHRRHQKVFRLAILFASLILAALLPSLAPQAIRLYLILGTLLFGYFVLIHVNSAPAPSAIRRMPKEIAVGVFFSAAVFIPTVARDPAIRLILLPGAILFALLCSLNCLFIYTWEHTTPLDAGIGQPPHPKAHLLTKLALQFLPSLAGITVFASCILPTVDHSLPWSIPAACGIAALLLLLLHRNSQRFSPTTLRAAADLCLLTPLLLRPLQLLH